MCDRDQKRHLLATGRALRLALGCLPLIFTAACNFPTSVPSTPDGALGTEVAATLTYFAPSASDTPAAPAGEATATSSSAATAAPTTPSGGVLRVVYTDGGNVWLREAGRPPVQLSQDGSADRVLISSDGAKVAFLRRTASAAPPELWAVDSDGTDSTVLIGPESLDSLYSIEQFPQHNIASIDFIPGTHTLMFNSQRVPEGPGLIKNDDLHVLNLDTGTLTTLLPPGDGGEFTFSPDGRQVAVAQPASLSLFNIDGTNPRLDVVTFPSLVTYSEFLFYPYPVWTPDSSAVGVVIPSEDILASNPTGTVWRVNAANGQATSLGTIAGNFFLTEYIFGHSSLSPGLDRIAFIRESGTPTVRTLYLALPAGTNAVLYDSDDISWHGWSPNGGAFVYSKTVQTELYLGAVDQAPAEVGPGYQVRWISSTDLLFLQGSAGALTLMRGQIGAAAVPLASSVGDFYDFSYEP